MRARAGRRVLSLPQVAGAGRRAFCRRAMDYDILLVPGDDFGCPGYARLAYCVARSQLERSLPAFRKLAESYGLSK